MRWIASEGSGEVVLAVAMLCYKTEGSEQCCRKAVRAMWFNSTAMLTAWRGALAEEAPTPASHSLQRDFSEVNEI